MKGIIFNLLEQVVTDEHGEETWESMLDRAGVEGVYTAVGTYPHEELVLLVEAASSLLSADPDDVTRWFGREAIPLLNERYPVFFDGHDRTASFVHTLNDVIHPEVRKLFPGAYAPEFEFEPLDDNSLALGYRSFRGLCMFAEGLVQGAADHYGERVAIEQTLCTRHGGDRCVLLCRFSKGE